MMKEQGQAAILANRWSVAGGREEYRRPDPQLFFAATPPLHRPNGQYRRIPRLAKPESLGFSSLPPQKARARSRK